MKIAVSGCGIVGSTVAALLAKDGHCVTIFEQAESCGPVGAGIMLQPSGQEILTQLGLADKVQACSASLDGLDARLASGRSLIQLRYSGLDASTRAWGVHRGQLFNCLLENCRASGVQIQNGKRLESFRRAAGGDAPSVEVVDQNGVVEPGFDFVIAADGSRSKLREASSIPYSKVDYPYAAMWATGPCNRVNRCLHQVIDGTQRLVGLLPIGSGQCSFFWGIRTDRYQALLDSGLDSWKREVTSMCPIATELLESIDSFDDLTFSGYRHVRMSHWHTESIIFLGDAAHASSPHLGQGANLALEDAMVFATALRDTRDFGEACKRFTAQRYQKICYYQQLTRLLTPFFQSDIAWLSFFRDIGLPWFPRIPIVRRRMLRTLCGLQSGWLR